jgi:hypothetical protein
MRYQSSLKTNDKEGILKIHHPKFYPNTHFPEHNNNKKNHKPILVAKACNFLAYQLSCGSIEMWVHELGKELELGKRSK